MFKKILFPLIFGLVLASYTSYAVLDTFVIEKNQGTVSFDDHFFDDISIPSSMPQSSKPQTSKTESSSSSQINSSSTNDTSSSSSSAEVSSSITESSSIVSSSSNSSSSIIPAPMEFAPIDFTEEPVMGEYSYTDSNMTIQYITETVQVKNKQGAMVNTVVYCADIHLKSISHMKTALAKDQFGQNIVEKTTSMAKRKGAVFAISGDYYGAQERGYVIRNGTVLRDVRKARDKDKGSLAIYTDGSFYPFKEREITLEEIQNLKLDQGAKAYQVFSFGPNLVNNGERVVKEGDEVAISSKLGNQRTSLGIVDELHYVAAVCDGRLDYSWGMELYQMADYMIGKGCKIAYNLDGGGSATFVFNNKLINTPNTNGAKDIEEREISDCVYFA